MPFTRGHALLIGVGAYAGMSYLDVPQAAADAAALAAALRDPARCGYPAEQVHVLTGAEATLPAVRAALQELSAVQAHDTVLVFYAGHGLDGTDGNYYLTTHESELRGPRLLAESGLAAGELLAAVQAIPAQRLLLLFNACYGGKLAPEVAGGLAAAQPDYTVTPPIPRDVREAVLSAGQGRILITACAPGEEAQTGEGNLTLFGQALVDAFAGDTTGNRGGTIGVFNLFEAVQADVTQQAELLGKQQHPEITVLRGAGTFPVAIYNGATTTTAEVPTEPLPAQGVKTVEPARSERMLAKFVNTGTIHVGDTCTQTVTGSGNAVAQGPGASATVINNSPFNQAGQTVGVQNNYFGALPGNTPAGNTLAAQPRTPGPGQLAANELAQVQAALLSAFTAGELERVAFFGLDVRLYDIAAHGPYPAVVFALVTWADGQGKLRPLVNAARAANRGNRALAACDELLKAKGM